MDFKDFKIDNLEFSEASYKRSNYKIFSWIYKLFSFDLVILPAPLILKKKDSNPIKEIQLISFSKQTCLLELVNEDILKYHNKKLSYRMLIILLVYMFSIYLFGGVFLLIVKLIKEPIASIVKLLESSASDDVFKTLITVIVSISIFIIIFTTFSLVVRFSFQLGAFLTNKRYADSMCIRLIIYLILMLAWDDVLLHPYKRKRLLIQINSLTRATSYIAFSQIVRSETNKSWARTHFRQIKEYIRERERWVLAPTETTLNDLRRDFYELAKIYITGDYGKFKWANIEKKEEKPRISISRQALNSLPRFLGLVLPLIFIGYLLLHPGILPAGFDQSLVWLVFIAWILLSIDATLKLGVVSGIISLAKEIKSLK